MDRLLKASLDWINDVAYPDEEFVHPNDENKVKCASRALYEMGVSIDNRGIVEYCKQLKMPKESIDKIVDWYSRPKGMRLKNGIVFSSIELAEIWNEMVSREEEMNRDNK